MPPYIFGKLNLAAFLEGVRYRRVHYGRLYCTLFNISNQMERAVPYVEESQLLCISMPLSVDVS